jgi:hypothetical protein
MTLLERFNSAADKAAFRRSLTAEQADLLMAELAGDHEPETTRGPDIVKDVESWIDETPQPSAMKSTRTGEPKLTRRARVRNKAGQLVEVTVVTTAKGWASASSEKVEGYLSQDKTKVYWQHHMVSAHSDANQFV